MNGTSGFQEMRDSISRSLSGRFVHEQWHQFGTGSWYLLRTRDSIALPTGISTKKKGFWHFHHSLTFFMVTLMGVGQ